MQVISSVVEDIIQDPLCCLPMVSPIWLRFNSCCSPFETE